MNNSYEFYKNRYDEIQRHAYKFLNQVPLTEEEQSQIIRKFSLGRDFVSINSVQDYNKDWLIKGYVKVDIREVKEPVGSIKGKFLDRDTFLKETMVQLPKSLFEMDEDTLGQVIISDCMQIAKRRIEECIATLRMQKIQIEETILRYQKLLEDYPCQDIEE